MFTAIMLIEYSKPLEMDLSSEYIIGAILALLVLGYLVYTLIKPEKF